MRRASVFAAVLLLAAAASPARAALSLSLRLSGGGTRLALADANAVLADWRTLRLKEVESFKTWALLEDKVAALHYGYDFDAEAILGVGRYFGLGIAAGVLNARLTESDAYLTVDRPAGTFQYAHTMTVNAFPVLVSAYAFLPLGAKLTVYVKAGGGVAWGKFTEREANKPVTIEKYAYPVSQSASAKGTIRAAGLGLRFAADEKLSFLAEVAARACTLTDFEGQSKEGYRGALYSFEQYDPRLQFWQRRFEIMEHSPQSPYFRNQGKARIDFGGVAVKLGVALAF